METQWALLVGSLSSNANWIEIRQADTKETRERKIPIEQLSLHTGHFLSIDISENKRAKAKKVEIMITQMQ